MFLQLVTPPVPNAADTQANINSLFLYHPLQISALVETVWRYRFNANEMPFVAWPQNMTEQILNDHSFYLGYDHSPASIPQSNKMLQNSKFTMPSEQPGIKFGPRNATNWHHLIYALCVENTRIFDIFSKVLETYMFSERLETPSPATQQFLRNTEYLLYGDGLPSMVWTTGSRLRRDEIANRMTAYYRMFGMDLAHSREIAAQHPYEKPDASNRNFIPTFEAFAEQVWIGIENASNTSGAKPTDDEAIATLARGMYDMMTTRRQNGNLAREEFRAVALMSWLDLAVASDTSIVNDLRANGSSSDQRLQKIAERVGMSAHPRSKPLLELAGPLAVLMAEIETSSYNEASNALFLYTPGSNQQTNVKIVIDQYSLATGHDVKGRKVALTERAPVPRLPPPRALARPNGHARPGAV